jgi:hypothetical protein
MDMIFDVLGQMLPVVFILAVGVVCYLLTRGIRSVLRKQKQFKAASRFVERNEAVKFLLPLFVGVVQALCIPAMIYGWFGIDVDALPSLLVVAWNKIVIGATAGVVSALAYKAVRRWQKGTPWSNGWFGGGGGGGKYGGQDPHSEDVPPDADKP